MGTERQTSSIRSTDQAVYEHLRVVAREGRRTPPSTELAAAAGLQSEKAGRAIIKRLEKAGLIQITRLGGNRRLILIIEDGTTTTSGRCSGDVVGLDRNSRKPMPPVTPGEIEALKAAYLARRKPTRCPTAACAITTAEIPPQARRQIKKYSDKVGRAEPGWNRPKVSARG